MESERIIGVHLGRFAPYTKGHETMTQAVIDQVGAENTLVLIGSSNKVNARTPYTAEQREAMIQSVFPDIQIASIGDSNATSVELEISRIEWWYEQVRKLQTQMRGRFVFFTGDLADLSYLDGTEFEYREAFPRDTVGKGISATAAREAIQSNDELAIQNLLPTPVIDQAVAFYRQNLEQGLLSSET